MERRQTSIAERAASAAEAAAAEARSAKIIAIIAIITAAILSEPAMYGIQVLIRFLRP